MNKFYSLSKVFFSLLFAILSIGLAGMVGAFELDNPTIPHINPITALTSVGGGGNVSFNQSLTDLLYWRLDGGNNPTANWNMSSYNFTDVRGINFLSGSGTTPTSIFGSAGNLYLQANLTKAVITSNDFYGKDLWANGGSGQLWASTVQPLNSDLLLQTADIGVTLSAAQVYFPSGTAGTPGIAFTSNGGTGLYYTGGGIGFSAGGTSYCTLGTNGLTCTAFRDSGGAFPSSTNIVTTNTNQIISGQKNFSSVVRATAGANISGASVNLTNLRVVGNTTVVGNITATGTVCGGNGCMDLLNVGNIAYINDTQTISGIWTFNQQLLSSNGTICMGVSSANCFGYYGVFLDAYVPSGWGATYPTYTYRSNDFNDRVFRTISTMTGGGLQSWNFINAGGTTVGALSYSAGTGGSDVQFLDGSGNFKGGIGAISTTGTGVFIGANNGLGAYNSLKEINVYETNVTIATNTYITGNVSYKNAYGFFSDLTTQTVAATGTAYKVAFNTTEDTWQISKSSDNKNFTFQRSGDYLIELSALLTTTSANAHAEIWVQKNGVNVPRSNTKIHIANANVETVLAVPFILDMNAGDNMSIMWAADSTNVQMLYTTNTSYSPETPSIIMSITRQSDLT